MIRYGSVCSGIEAVTVAWHGLGFVPAFFSEIDPAPRAVLAHRWPGVPLHGDFTTIGADDYGPVELLVGGTPCQSFSVAGLRGGLDDDRGNLALEYLRLAQRKGPKWLVWENVPGVLSSDGGRDFGAILGGMVELGYGVAYRVLDAQFFGVPQRRRRVFAVGYLGDWRRAAAILFERHGLSGHPAPRRETGQRIADSLTVGANQCSGFPGDFTEASTGGIAHCLNAGGMGRQDYETETLIATSLTASRSSTQCPNEDTTLIAHSLRGEGFDASEDGTGRGTPLVPVVAFAQNSRDELREMPYVGALSAEPGMKQQSYVRQASAVRRLTPTECLRLQGFPDTYFDGVMLRGKPLADGPKYKMLGNSMCVNVMTWIGQRILMVEALGLADQEQAA